MENWQCVSVLIAEMWLCAVWLTLAVSAFKIAFPKLLICLQIFLGECDCLLIWYVYCWFCVVYSQHCKSHGVNIRGRAHPLFWTCCRVFVGTGELPEVMPLLIWFLGFHCIMMSILAPSCEVCCDTGSWDGTWVQGIHPGSNSVYYLVMCLSKHLFVILLVGF